MLVFLTLAHHVNRCAPFCYSSFSLTRQLVSVSSSHPLVQAASANPSFPFHPPYTYATSCSCHRSPCPIWQSQTEQQLTAHSFASFWFRLMPRAAGVRIIAHRSSVALLEWNEGENDRACCGSCFPFQGCEFSFLVVMEGRRKEKNNRKTRSLISRSLFFHLVSCFLSLLLFPLPFLSWPFSIFFCCLVWRSKKTKRFHFIFFFSFSCFRLFFTRQCGVENPARLIDLNLGNFVTKQGWFLLQYVEWKHSHHSYALVITNHLKWFLGQKWFWDPLHPFHHLDCQLFISGRSTVCETERM